MITKEFKEYTDSLISRLSEMSADTGNGNVIIAKPAVHEKTAGGLFIDPETMKRESNRRNFARIVSIPNNLDPEGGDMDLKVGDYCFYTFTAESPLHPAVLTALLGIKVEDRKGQDVIVTFTQDREIVMTVPKEKVHGNLID